jgi:hypothetical protein
MGLSWKEHVAKFRAEHPEVPYKKVFGEAAKTYNSPDKKETSTEQTDSEEMSSSSGSSSGSTKKMKKKFEEIGKSVCKMCICKMCGNHMNNKKDGKGTRKRMGKKGKKSGVF